MNLAKLLLVSFQIACLLFVSKSWAQYEPDPTKEWDYNVLIMDCTAWADSNGSTTDEYLNCVRDRWYEDSKKMAQEVIEVLDDTGNVKPLAFEENALREDVSFEKARQACRSEHKISCMEKFFLENTQSSAIKIVENRKDIREMVKKVKDSHFENYPDFAGAPFCSDVEEFVYDRNGHILKNLLEKGYLVEGEVLEADYFGLGEDVMAVVSSNGWQLPGEERQSQDSSVYDSNAGYAPEKTITAGFHKDTLVKRLARKTKKFLIFNSTVGVTKSFARILPQEELLSENKKMKDVYAGELILSSTVAKIKEKQFQRNCWAEIERRHEERLNDFSVGFVTVKLSGPVFDDASVLKTTSQQGVYALFNDDSPHFKWIKAGQRYESGNYVLLGKSLYNPFDGDNVPASVDSVDFEYSHDSDDKIYHFSVPETDVFYADGVLVHNAETR